MKLVKCLIVFLVVMLASGLAIQSLGVTYPSDVLVILLGLGVSIWWMRKIWIE